MAQRVVRSRMEDHSPSDPTDDAMPLSSLKTTRLEGRNEFATSIFHMAGSGFRAADVSFLPTHVPQARQGGRCRGSAWCGSATPSRPSPRAARWPARRGAA